MSYAIGLTRMLYLCSWGLKSLEKITSFFGLLHLWNIFGRDKANENNEQGEILGKKLKKYQNDKFPGQILLIELHSDNIGGEEASHHPTISAQGGGVGIFLFKLSNKTWKIFHLFSPRQRYLWNIYNAFCKNVLGENPQRETLLRRFNKIDPESALRKSFVLAAEILWTSKTFDWYFSSATWLLRKIIRVQLQMHLKVKFNTSEQFIL